MRGGGKDRKEEKSQKIALLLLYELILFDERKR
jgi:hypothetical protein